MIRLTPPAQNKRHKVLLHINEFECKELLEAIGKFGEPGVVREPAKGAVHAQLKELRDTLANIRRSWRAHPDSPNNPPSCVLEDKG